MHMSDALISPEVAGVMGAVTTATLGYCVYKAKDNLEEKKIPLMGVMGAFVFCAQMINFTIPGTGSSGHIGGGLILASVLGSVPAFLVLATVIAIQALFFADGGILALGCNIFNMGFYSCLVFYPLIFKKMLNSNASKAKIIAASVITSVIGLQCGAFSVVLETLLSGRTELPFTSFLLLMQPIHFAIGIGEGLITGAVLCYIQSIRPEVLEFTRAGNRLPSNLSLKKIIIGMVVLTGLVGGLLSLYASEYPDGLEWSIGNITSEEELSTQGTSYEISEKIQESSSFMPDYNFKDNEDSKIGTSIAGLGGGAIVFILALIIGFVISRIKNMRKI
ncbi:energy-coupling factor ABC transporter permease [uncultured Clostridium sp.]|uniref:energy-coupling factor ABC transporter permease n=1 Tax=uncultured Clostridium sp. TaxID=59620 RepID=UPI002600EED0|nr:energy-coupling factor ABC transporter permease [uncultured Clostridium sp.]